MNIILRLFLILSLSLSTLTHAEPSKHYLEAIQKGLQYIASTQLEYGEFPSIFYPNKASPNDILYANYDSNLFMSAMIAADLNTIDLPVAAHLTKRVARYVLSQINNDRGLWSYFTTHSIAPLYPNTVYDLDDTAVASMVLKQNGYDVKDNFDTIKANRDESGAYLTFFDMPREHNDVDCGVNANALIYMQDNDTLACEYLNQVISTGENCAVYYSQLDAYYLITRAYHGGVICLAPSVETLKNYILNRFNGSDNVDDNVFETAAGVNSLLDLDYRGIEVSKGVRYIASKQSKLTGGWPSVPFWLWTMQGGYVAGRSGSGAMTTAIAIKALHRWQHQGAHKA